MPSSNIHPTEGSIDVVPSNKSDNGDNGKVQMKKQLGLVEGTAIILGIIFGSGETLTLI